MELLANSRGQALTDHLVAVGILAYWKAASLGLPEDQALSVLMGGLLHDVGKADAEFQRHIRKALRAGNHHAAGRAAPPVPLAGAGDGGEEDEQAHDSYGAETGRDAGKPFPHHHELSWAVLCHMEQGPGAPHGLRHMADDARWLAYHHHARKYWGERIGTADGRAVYHYANSAAVIEAAGLENALAAAALADAMVGRFGELSGKKDVIHYRGGSGQALADYAGRSPSAVPELFGGQTGIANPWRLAVRSLQRSSLIWADRRVSAMGREEARELAALDIAGARDFCDGIIRADRAPGPGGAAAWTYDLGNAPCPRTVRQEELARDASAHVTTVMAPPCGYGKTRIGLLWAAMTTATVEGDGRPGPGRLVWVVPRNAVAKGIASQIGEELRALGMNLSWELFLGSSRIEASAGAPEEPFSADIVITNIDNALAPFARHAWADRIAAMNQATIVFDEFHEFASEAPLFAIFVTLMASRHNVTRAPTLLLSATPLAMWRLWEDHAVPATHVAAPVPPLSDKEIRLTLIRSMEEAQAAVRDGGAAVMNSVSQAQRHHAGARTDHVAHSLYTEAEKDLILGTLLRKFGREHHEDNAGSSISAGPIIQASLGISVATLVDSVASPEATLQRLGRLDRFVTLPSPHYLPLITGERRGAETSAVNGLYDRELAGRWRETIQNYAEAHGTFRMADLVALYRAFSEENAEAIHRWLLRTLRESHRALGELPPLRAPARGNVAGPHKGRAAARGNLRAAEGGHYLTARVVRGGEATGEVLGPAEALTVTAARARRLAEALAGDARTTKRTMRRLNEAGLGYEYPAARRGPRRGEIPDAAVTAEGLLRASRRHTAPLPASAPGDQEASRGGRERYVYHRAGDGGPGMGLIREEHLWGARPEGADDDPLLDTEDDI